MKNMIYNSPSFKSRLSVLGGTFFEFYEFTLYGIFCSYFSTLFFPPQNEKMALSYSLVIFAVGSLARPLGGILFGYLGDTVGRKKALCISMLMMAVPTFMIGVLPTYQSIGIGAFFILGLCRILQGLSAGGEFNGASIYMIEHSNTKFRGVNGSMPVAISAIGTLVAMLLGSCALYYEQRWFNWRSLFILGALGGIAVFIGRDYMNETPVFEKAKENPNVSRQCYSAKALLGVVGIGCFGSVSGFSLFTYFNIYLNKTLQMALPKSMLFSTVGIFIFIVLNPLFGYLSNWIKSARIMIFSCLMTFLLSVPIYKLLSGASAMNILAAETLMAICAASFTGPMNYFLIDLFPVKMRYRGLSLGYSLGIAIFGGTMPLICTALIERTGSKQIPSFYLMFSALVGFCSVVGLTYYTAKLKDDRLKDIH